ncbi:MAG TPA: hypothetical protein G4N98_09600 [Thermoflexia bacterium]|nr:hypothetical protein [Thermoflexia bacterium]
MRKLKFVSLFVLLTLLVACGGPVGESPEPRVTEVHLSETSSPPQSTATSTLQSTATLKPPATPQSEPRPSGDSGVLIFKENAFFRTTLTGDVLLPLFTSPERAAGEGPEAWRGLLVNPPRISPDGRWMIERGARAWWLVDLQTGEAVHKSEIELHLHRRSVTWSPDSQQFAYLDHQLHLCIYDLPAATETCLLEEPPFWNLFWSPDGAHIAALEAGEHCCTGDVWLIELPNGAREAVARYSTAPEPPLWGDLAWTPDGTGLLIKNVGETPAELYSLASGRTRTLPAPALNLSPDGDLILYNFARTGLAGVGRLAEPEPWFLPHDPACGDLLELQNWAWAPEGDRLAYVTPCLGKKSTLYLVDAAQEELLWTRELPDIQGRILLWTPDGEYLLLDDYRYSPASPVWRLPATGAGPLEVVAEEGLLIAVIPALRPE